MTTKDIARASGVSTATVSYVLSEREDARVSEPTRQRVLEAARQLGYRRNSLAAALRTGRMYTVGIVAPYASGSTTRHYSQYVKDLLIATSVAAGRAGMNAVLFVEKSVTNLPPEKLADHRVDGVILFGVYDEEWVRSVIRTDIPYAEIGSGVGSYQVHADNCGGARLAVEHLVSLGHRRIAHWAGRLPVVSAQRRLEGFRNAIRDAGIPEAPVVNSDEELRLLLTRPDRPTACFLYNDELAISALDAARDVGLRVPQDLSLVGFDNSILSVIARPPLTTIQNPLDDMADAAVRLVRAQVERLPVPELAPVPTSLVIRESTAAAQTVIRNP